MMYREDVGEFAKWTGIPGIGEKAASAAESNGSLMSADTGMGDREQAGTGSGDVRQEGTGQGKAQPAENGAGTDPKSTQIKGEAAGKGKVASVMIQNVSIGNGDEKPQTVEIAAVAGAAKLNEEEQAVFAGLDGVLIEAGKRFSFGEWLEGREGAESAPDDEKLSYMASVLYEAAVRAGLESGERHLHRVLPEYAHPGFDVYYRTGTNDLTLYNPGEVAVSIGIGFETGLPEVTLYAPQEAGWQPGAVTVTRKRYPPEQTAVADLTLAPGTSERRSAGRAGLLVEVEVGDKGTVRDFYLPEPVIVAYGPEPEQGDEFE